MKPIGLALRMIPRVLRGLLVDAAVALLVAYLRWRVRCANDELDELRARRDWLPRQMQSHRQHVRRWNAEITAILDDQTRRHVVEPTLISDDLADARDELCRVSAAWEDSRAGSSRCTGTLR